MDLTHAYNITQLAGFGALSDSETILLAHRICSDLLVSKLALNLLGESDLPIKALGLMSPAELGFFASTHFN